MDTMIPFYSSNIVKVVYFSDRHEFDCAKGGYTLNPTDATIYDIDEPDDQILAYYDDSAIVIKMKMTMETYIK